MSPRTRVLLAAGAALIIGAVFILDRWNRALEAAVTLPYVPERHHPSIPESIGGIRVRVDDRVPRDVALLVDERFTREYLNRWEDPR